MSSLLAHEDRLNSSREKVQEKAFQVKGEFSYKEKIGNSARRGHNRGNFRGRGGSGSDRGKNPVGEFRQEKYSMLMLQEICP